MLEGGFLERIRTDTLDAKWGQPRERRAIAPNTGGLATWPAQRDMCRSAPSGVQTTRGRAEHIARSVERPGTTARDAKGVEAAEPIERFLEPAGSTSMK